MTIGHLNCKCPECGGTSQVRRSQVAGLAACGHCGKVFAPPADVEEVGEEQMVPRADELPEEHLTIPDQIEVEYGWRAWGIRRKRVPGQLTVLQSATHTAAFWTPRVPMEATCDIGKGRRAGKQPGEGHEVPFETCSCGLYSARTLEHLMTMHYHRYDAAANGMFHLIGKVALWGKVIPGSQGWRAQFGYPAELYLPYEAWHLADELRDAYGVPVMLKNFLKAEVEIEE